MSKNLDTLLANMGFEENFEENFNLDTKVVQAIEKLPVQDQAHIVRAMAVAKATGSTERGIVRRIGEAQPGDIHSLIAESVGDLNLTVTRSGVSINAVLPFVLFGYNDSVAKYASTLRGFLNGLPAGTQLTITIDATGSYVFTYVNGANTDTVTVENLGNINYQSFLSSMSNNFFATKYFLISVTDEAFATAQFAQPLNYGLLSALGMTGANQMILRSRTNSWMFRKDRIEVVMPEQKIVPDFSFVMSIVKADGFSIGFDFFMSRRLNLNKM